MMKRVRIWGLLALFALLISLPFVVGDPTFTSMGVYILLYTAAAVAWNLFSGYRGLHASSALPEVQHSWWHRPFSALAAMRACCRFFRYSDWVDRSTCTSKHLYGYQYRFLLH